MYKPLVYVIILNNNRHYDTIACLASLSRSDYKNMSIILLDNSSTDGSISVIRNEYPAVQIISLEKNLGYAGNNNIGIKAALAQGAEWVFILNDDTLLDSSCLTLLLDAVEKDPEIGVVGPMVYHYDEPNVIQSAGGSLDNYWRNVHLGQNETDLGQFHSLHLVEWVSGCAILVKNKMVEKIGLLDERFFMYWEEIEWCIRAGRVGWKIAHIPQAKLWHKGVNRDYQAKPYVTYYITRNHLLTLSKHKAPMIVWVYTLIRILVTLMSWSVKPRWRSKLEHRDAMWKGFVHFIQGRYGKM
jgi:GT2 family glycosyltransferase